MFQVSLYNLIWFPYFNPYKSDTFRDGLFNRLKYHFFFSTTTLGYSIYSEFPVYLFKIVYPE